MTVPDPGPPPVAPGTVQVWSDLLCPFARLMLHRFRQARERLGLPVAVEHPTFAPAHRSARRRGRARRASQSLAVGEALDLGLRRAFWTQSRSITHRAVVLEIAAEVRDAGTELDVAAITHALDTGAHRPDVTADHIVAQTDAIPASPTLRLADGATYTNPGTAVEWAGPWAAGYPVITSHDPDVLADIVCRAATSAPA